LFVISGGRDGATWEAAARAYRDAYARLLPEATAAGIRLAIEVIHPLRQDLSFINTLADAREIARAAGRRGGYVLDFFHSGWERRLLETVRADAAARIHAVQISDVKRVTLRTMDRALIGQGVLPLRAIRDAIVQRREPASPVHAAADLEPVDRAPDGLGVAARERGARLGALVARRVEELRDQAVEGVRLALELVAAELLEGAEVHDLPRRLDRCPRRARRGLDPRPVCEHLPQLLELDRLRKVVVHSGPQ